jgi:hypothetical protein
MEGRKEGREERRDRCNIWMAYVSVYRGRIPDIGVLIDPGQERGGGAG